MTSGGVSSHRLTVSSSSHVSARPFFFLSFRFFRCMTACECAPAPSPPIAPLLTGFGLVSFISISLFISLAYRLTSDDQTRASEKGKSAFVSRRCHVESSHAVGRREPAALPLHSVPLFTPPTTDSTDAFINHSVKVA